MNYFDVHIINGPDFMLYVSVAVVCYGGVTQCHATGGSHQYHVQGEEACT